MILWLKLSLPEPVEEWEVELSVSFPLMDEIKVVAAVEVAGHPIVGRDVGQGLGLGRTGVLACDKLANCIEQADVVIDFTNHEASLNYLKIAGEKNRAIVIGSTGFTAVEMKKVKELAKNTRCVLAPNMSVGVNVMLKVLDRRERPHGALPHDEAVRPLFPPHQSAVSRSPNAG